MADWGLLSSTIPQLCHFIKAPFLMEGEPLGIFPVERMIVSTAWQSEETPATAPLLFVLESDPGAPSGEEGRRGGGAELHRGPLPPLG